jgi:hypothetical protein
MADRRIVKRVVRTDRVSEQEAQRLNEIRRQAMEDVKRDYWISGMSTSSPRRIRS